MGRGAGICVFTGIACQRHYHGRFWTFAAKKAAGAKLSLRDGVAAGPGVR